MYKAKITQISDIDLEGNMVLTLEFSKGATTKLIKVEGKPDELEAIIKERLKKLNSSDAGKGNFQIDQEFTV